MSGPFIPNLQLKITDKNSQKGSFLSSNRSCEAMSEDEDQIDILPHLKCSICLNLLIKPLALNCGYS